MTDGGRRSRAASWTYRVGLGARPQRLRQRPAGHHPDPDRRNWPRRGVRGDGDPDHVSRPATRRPHPITLAPQGRVGTRLRRRSAAVVTWLCELHPDEVMELGGDVPVRKMTEILE